MELERLNQRIIKSGIKKTKIAEKVGVHRVHLSRILNEVSKRPNQKIISKIKKILRESNL